MKLRNRYARVTLGALLWLAGCGSTTGGALMTDGGPEGARGLDANDLEDSGGRSDLGLFDAGVVACEPLEAGPIPSEWPFEDSYQNVFWNPIVGVSLQSCAASTCHGPTAGNPPLITAAMSQQQQAAAEIWDACLLQDRGGEMVIPLLWAHNSMGNNENPPYDLLEPETFRRLEKFCALGEVCAWADPIRNIPPGCSRDGGIPDGNAQLTCPCPPPENIDISRCAE